MPPLNRRLDRLRSLPRALRDAALAATLPVAGPQERDALVAEILPLTESPRSAWLLLDVVHAWADLSPAARAAVISHLGPRMGPLIAQLRDSRDPADRRASAHLAIACLTTPGGAAQRGAEAEADVARAIDELGVSADVDAALAAAAEEFNEHRMHSVLDVIARIAHCAGPRLRALLADESQPALLPLRAAAKSLPAEVQRRRVVLWLALPSLASIARQRLEACESAADRLAAFEQAHYLLARGRTGALRRMERPRQLLGEDGTLGGAETPTRRGRIRWIERLPFKDAQRHDELAVYLADPDSLVRFDAVSALSRMEPTRAVDSTLIDFTFDADPRVAAGALSVLADAETPARRRFHAPAVARLKRSPHPRVRAMAESAAAEFDPWAEPIDTWSCPVAARMRLAEAPLEFLIELRRDYGRAGSAGKIMLLGLASRLGVLDRMESELLEAAVGADEMLASKAALLLGRLDSPDARAVLDGAVESGPPRVRANAFEALAMASPDDPRLRELTRDSVARLRANAVRHMLRTRTEDSGAQHALAEMLADPRPAHRLSALWVAERVPVFTLVARIADMTRSDPDPAVHARAKASARRLLAAMRQGWAGGASQGVVVTRPLPATIPGAAGGAA